MFSDTDSKNYSPNEKKSPHASLPPWYIRPYGLSRQPITTIAKISYILLLLPRISFGFIACIIIYVYIWSAIKFDPSINRSGNSRAISSQHYMIYFAFILTFNLDNSIRIKGESVLYILKSFIKNMKYLHQAYCTIMQVDDVFDLDKNSSHQEKKERLKEIFNTIRCQIVKNKSEFSPVEKDTQNSTIHTSIKKTIDTLPLNKLSYDEKISINLILARCEAAYLIEIESKSSEDFWLVLRSQAFALTELCFIAAIYIRGGIYDQKTYIKNLPFIQTCAHVMFMGNIADDWMDFFWTKEDAQRVCYINSYIKENELQQRSKWYVYLKVLNHMLTRTTMEVGAHQSRARAHAKNSWILPTHALLSILTGPLNILLWLFTRR